MMLTQERLKECLRYSPIVGVFEWRRAGRRVRPGFLAGAVGGNGYVRICVDGRSYPAHHLAWLYMTGEWPSGEIDHKDGDRSNNAWANLRIATREQNARNSAIGSRNTSGIKGVRFNKATGKWRASVMAGGKVAFSGSFNTKEEADLAARAARERLHGEFANHGKHRYQIEDEAS